MLNIFYSFFIFILTLGILITVHEFGHFLSARLCGVYVKTFSIGFGKKIISYKDKKNTEFVISAIPLGGYVKMMNKKNLQKENTSYLFNQCFENKNFLQKFLIIISGPLANFLLAIFIYFIIFMKGTFNIKPIINYVNYNSIIWKANIEPGLEIKSIDNYNTSDWEEVRMQLLTKIGKKKVYIELYDHNNKSTIKKIINLETLSSEEKILQKDPITAIGIDIEKKKIGILINKVKENSIAQKYGIQPGDIILKINQTIIDNWENFLLYIKNNINKNIVLDIKRQNKLIILNIKNVNKLNYTSYDLGLIPNTLFSNNQNQIFQKYSFISAIYQSINKVFKIIKITIILLGKLIIGDIKLSNLSGPISVAQGAAKSASYGFFYYLIFLSLISINLGIVNLLPLPSLDGGHVLFLLIEKIKGLPLSEKTQLIFYKIGTVIIFILMTIALFNDFFNLY